ncbi:MAG: hypothetical protein IT254_01695 [Chitinophagaceae bacterium]|mgnify:CR=1 FL=1|nr:hypothetical protein [Bacteroidota bacterium]MCC6257014.1 hypothetical protein [Chitinophagaceae bacterium]MCW5917624.1 hypothetical protein [Ferruginibacter sp.]
MNREEISAILQQFIKTEILAGGKQIEENASLRQAGVDSFSIIEIILFIENRFNVLIPDEKLLPENFETLQQLSAVVHNLMQANP